MRGSYPRVPRAATPELPEKRPAHQSTPTCRSKSLELDPVFLSFNPDPVLPE